VKITRTEQTTIRPRQLREQAARARVQVKLVARPDGVLVVKVATAPNVERAQASALARNQIKSRSKDWLQLTRRSPVSH
jgi:hypothetical protein